MSEKHRLNVHNHDRDSAGLTYVYPVVSRRAGGVSIGINLNPNNACNWQCIYCQVPNLSRGDGPPIDLAQLEAELVGLLDDMQHGDFMQRAVPPEARTLKDIAFSGNGEPTTSPQFVEAVELVDRVLRDAGLARSNGDNGLNVVLITNGSMLSKPRVLEAIDVLHRLGGEVWFKLDAATPERTALINGQRLSIERHTERLRLVAARCRTFVQTCVMAVDGEAPSDKDQLAYLDLLAGLTSEAVPLAGVLLYGIARTPQGPDAARLAPLQGSWLEAFGDRIRALGLAVKVTQ